RSGGGGRAVLRGAGALLRPRRFPGGTHRGRRRGHGGGSAFRGIAAQRRSRPLTATLRVARADGVVDPAVSAASTLLQHAFEMAAEHAELCLACRAAPPRQRDLPRRLAFEMPRDEA